MSAQGLGLMSYRFFAFLFSCGFSVVGQTYSVDSGVEGKMHINPAALYVGLTAAQGCAVAGRQTRANRIETGHVTLLRPFLRGDDELCQDDVFHRRVDSESAMLAPTNERCLDSDHKFPAEGYRFTVREPEALVSIFSFPWFSIDLRLSCGARAPPRFFF